MLVDVVMPKRARTYILGSIPNMGQTQRSLLQLWSLALGILLLKANHSEADNVIFRRHGTVPILCLFLQGRAAKDAK